MREIDIAFVTICMCRNFPSSPRIYASYLFSKNLHVCLFDWAWPHLVISRSFPGRMSTFFASRQTAGRQYVACFSPAKNCISRRRRRHSPAHTTHPTTTPNITMACIASTFTGSVAALKASKVQVRLAAARRSRSSAGSRDLANARFPQILPAALRPEARRR